MLGGWERNLTRKISCNFLLDDPTIKKVLASLASKK